MANIDIHDVFTWRVLTDSVPVYCPPDGAIVQDVIQAAITAARVTNEYIRVRTYDDGTWIRFKPSNDLASTMNRWNILRPGKTATLWSEYYSLEHGS